jgi:beta-barrel assembly-enhancing protease
VRALRGGDVAGNQRYFEDSIAARKDSTPLWYGFALHQLRQRNFDGAKAALAKIPVSPELALTRTLLEADISLGMKNNDWREIYERLSTELPNHRVIATKYVRALLSSDKRADGLRAVDILRNLTERVSDDPSLYEQLSRAYQVGGDNVRAGEAFAYATALRGAFEDSLLQLQNVAARKDLDYYERARIDAQITELMPIVLELRKRNIDARSAQVVDSEARPSTLR